MGEIQIKKNLDNCFETAFEVAADTASAEHALSGEFARKNMAEFFAGIGLFGLALERFGWKMLFANDIDPDKHEIFKHNFPNLSEKYKVGNVHSISGDDIPTVTLATASFPCTDLSLAGNQKGLDGKQSGALLGFFRILKEMEARRPPIVILENVSGFLTCRKGEDFKTALKKMNDLGYSVDAFLINAVHFVPQSRLRLFVIGTRDDFGFHSPMEPQNCIESSFRPPALIEVIRNNSIRWRILNLPEIPQSKHTLTDILEEFSDDSKEWWSRERIEYLLGQMSERHSKYVAERINNNKYSYGTVFRRMRRGKSMAELRVDGIAGCLRTPRGGSSRQILVRMGKGKVTARFLTPRECARLQGVQDSYVINVPMNQAYFGFGDAVCLPVIEWIATHYLNALTTQLTRKRLITSDAFHSLIN